MNKYKLTKAGINVSEATERFGGNFEMLEEFLGKFVENEYYPKLKTAIECNDVKAAFEAAHALKGMTGNLSMTQLYDSIYALVEELRAERTENLETLFKSVNENYESVCSAITAMM